MRARWAADSRCDRLWSRYPTQDLLYHVGRDDARNPKLRPQQKAMRQRRDRHCLDIVGRHEIATAHCRLRPGKPQQGKAASRRCTQRDPPVLPCRPRNVDDVFLDRWVDIHVFERGLHSQEFIPCRHLWHMRLVHAPPAASRQDLSLLLAAGIADRNPHDESVELRLGQRVGAFEIDRVLRGDDQKRHAQRVGGTLHSDLSLLHRFEQRGLGLGCRAVDLVGKQQLGEDRSPAELEASLPLIVEKAPGYVARQQIGRELDAFEVQIEGLAQ